MYIIVKLKQMPRQIDTSGTTLMYQLDHIIIYIGVMLSVYVYNTRIYMAIWQTGNSMDRVQLQTVHVCVIDGCEVCAHCS